MISMIFKFTIAFTLSYFLLSVNISGKPLFYQLSKFTGPVGDDIQKSISKSIKSSIRKSKELGEQFINSSVPKYVDDSIKSKQSSVKKSKQLRSKNTHLIREELRRDEKIELDKLIDKN